MNNRLAVSEGKIHEMIQSVWDSVLGLELISAESLEVPDGENHSLTGCIQISGAWTGGVILSCSAELARKIAAAMFDMDPSEAALDEIQDALGELVNMIAGNFKNTLEGSCELSLPAVTQGFVYSVTIPGTKVDVQAEFRCEGEPVILKIVKMEER